MIRFSSTKLSSDAEKTNGCDYDDYPINLFSKDSIWPEKNKKITRCIVVSAYTDCEWIDGMVDYVEENRNKKSIEIRLYLDYFASKFSILKEIKERLIEINSRIKKLDPNGGIFLIKKFQLFHSKIIITETEKLCKVIVGSVNFTQKAFEKNEEIALVDDFNDPDKYPHYTYQIEYYIEKLNAIAKNVSEINESEEHNSLRSRMMDGVLYWKNSDYKPFSFNLGLSTSLLNKISKFFNSNENSPLEKYWNRVYPSTLPVSKLFKNNFEEKSKDKQEEKVKWKYLSLETPYGFWVPREYVELVEKSISRQSKKTEKKLKVFCRDIKESEEDIVTNFNEFYNALTYECGKVKKMDRKDSNAIISMKSRWNEWFDRLKKKIGVLDEKNKSPKEIEEIKRLSEKFLERLYRSYNQESVPDIWNDEIAIQEFEDNVVDCIRFSGQCKDSKPWIVKQIMKKKENSDLEDDKELILSALINCKFALPNKKTENEKE
ncbi:phospholipase D family protein [Fibrobacter sp.]|uniref:phospholipase D family protein n=1 Tax=Fibrobacter sp. TaxID=35828 RepID=UPI0025BEC13A|nr:phospholipase D family protein [Fibrobacter sp.]MBR3074017.1 phospholipase D family protein [Fibrobacter sp.]